MHSLLQLSFGADAQLLRMQSTDAQFVAAEFWWLPQRADAKAEMDRMIKADAECKGGGGLSDDSLARTSMVVMRRIAGTTAESRAKKRNGHRRNPQECRSFLQGGDQGCDLLSTGERNVCRQELKKCKRAT